MGPDGASKTKLGTWALQKNKMKALETNKKMLLQGWTTKHARTVKQDEEVILGDLAHELRGASPQRIASGSSARNDWEVPDATFAAQGFPAAAPKTCQGKVFPPTARAIGGFR
jgi:hypothetical protein